MFASALGERMRAFAFTINTEHGLVAHNIFGGLSWCGVQVLDNSLSDFVNARKTSMQKSRHTFSEVAVRF
jgi:hypothetical protein